MTWRLGEVMARLSAGSQSFDPKTSPAHGGTTPSDIAAAIATVRKRPAALLIQAKYIDHDPEGFDARLLIHQYQRECALGNRVMSRIKRPVTLEKLARAALANYISEPRCPTCRGGGQDWSRKELKFITCNSCAGAGGRVLSVRGISRLSGLSRSKIKKEHIRCFWEMNQILTVWESIAAHQIRRALRR